MRIAYVTHTRFPTEKAHGMQVAQVCHALSRLGHQVTLVTPTVENSIHEDPHAYYGLPHSFDVLTLEHFDARTSPWVPGFLHFRVSMRAYRRELARYFASEKPDLIYARSPLLLSELLATGVPVILELHSLPRVGRWIFVRNCHRCRSVVCLTSLLKHELQSWGVKEENTIVEGDAVDLDRFRDPVPLYEAKEQWKLPRTAPVIAYVGTLVTQNTIEKGVPELIEAFVLLQKKGIKFFGWIVGGPHEWVETYKARAKELGIDAHIRFEGAIRVEKVPSALSAVDVCVYPAPRSAHPYFTRDTSPLKLFEYMAAEKPIVCADLPPLRDVVDEKLVEFCEPGDAQSLAHAIGKVLKNPDAAREKARRAFLAMGGRTWEKRMKRILDAAS
ncbi:MAG: group 1 glycosyl transferase [Candidatus Peregrinibacteria bacterium Greene0416_19]|nr:MAG: group 1 glycosyl transferase [Candidatus Peregrinibacteria bacterium Greene0416_19]